MSEINKSKIAVCKLVTPEVASGEKTPEEVKNFEYNEEDITYDDPMLCITAQHWADNETEDRNIEVFEIKGNYIFTDSGIFAALYMDNLTHVNNESA